MFLADLKNQKIDELFEAYAMGSCTYKARYAYWTEQLFERVMRLFVWTGTGDVPAKEIEQRLILAGHCGITRRPRQSHLTAMYGSFFGVTEYQDEFTNYTVHCPIWSGTRTIGKDIVVINNNSLRNTVYPLIHSYAQLLAHTEVTFMDMLVNARDSNGVPVANTEIAKRSIKSYQAKKFNGQYDVVMDPAFTGVDFRQTVDVKANLFQELWETRNNILKDFYSDIGVKSAFEKQSNTIDAEVRSNDSLLLLNIKDMIEYRKKGAEEVNKMFGTSWSVEVAKEILIGLEEEVPENEND